MRTRVTTLFLACVAFVSVVAVAPAQAACRPTTLAVLFPPEPETTTSDTVPPAQLVPALSVPTTTGPVEPGMATTTSTTTTGPIDPGMATTTSTTTTDPNATTTTTVDPNTTTTTVDPNAATTTTTTTPGPRPTPVASCSYVYRFQWPVLGGGAVLSVFGSERDLGARRHAGVDISAPKMTPVVAVRDGTVSTIHDEPGNCCWVGIRHDDGWSSWYVHLNNDIDGTDDGDGVGIHPGLVVGGRVVAGEVIGWVGDSGNAEPTTPHLHFELRMPSGVAIDPLASLRWAFRQMPAPALEFGPAHFSGPYFDDDGLTTEPMFGLLTSLGALSSCDPWSAAVCPHSEATSLDAVSWISALSRVLIPVWAPTTTSEIVGQMIEEARTCPVEGCPAPSITVGEAASILVWVQDQNAHEYALAAMTDALEANPALTTAGLVPPAPQDYWLTDPFISLATLTQRGLADSCPITAPTADQVLTRGGLADLIAKAFGYLPVMTCGALS